MRILLQEGHANPQIRRSDNGWVAMHEAASYGHVKCIRMLYLYNAPLRPRTSDNEIPLHLSLKNGHEAAVHFFGISVVKVDCIDVITSLFELLVM